MSAPPLTDAVVVIAHADPDWPKSYLINLDVSGLPLAMGRDPHRAAAHRLIEEGYSTEHMLVLRYADNSKPMAYASIGDVLIPNRGTS